MKRTTSTASPLDMVLPEAIFGDLRRAMLAQDGHEPSAIRIIAETQLALQERVARIGAARRKLRDSVPRF